MKSIERERSKCASRRNVKKRANIIESSSVRNASRSGEIFFACGRLLYLVVRTKQNWPSQREATPDRFLGGSSFAGFLLNTGREGFVWIGGNEVHASDDRGGPPFCDGVTRAEVIVANPPETAQLGNQHPLKGIKTNPQTLLVGMLN